MVLHLTLAYLLALSPSDQGNLLLYICVGCFSLLAAVASVAKIYEAFFKAPKAKSEHITRAEFEGFVNLTNAKFQAGEGRMEEMTKQTVALMSSLNAELRSIHRSIGKLEGIFTGRQVDDHE